MPTKGRSKDLIQKRDEMLLRRYYYWTEIQRRRFDDTLRILSREEFFISEERIMAIIRNNADKLSDIKIKPVPKVRIKKASPFSQLEIFPTE